MVKVSQLGAKPWSEILEDFSCLFLVVLRTENLRRLFYVLLIRACALYTGRRVTTVSYAVCRPDRCWQQIFPGRKRWPRVQRHSHICRMSALHDSHWDTEICRRHDLAGDLGPSIAFSFVGSALPATKIDRMSFRTNQCCTLWFLGKSTICLSGLLSRVIRVMAMRRPLNQQDSTIRFCRHTW